MHHSSLDNFLQLFFVGMQNRNYCNSSYEHLIQTIPTAQITFSVSAIPSLMNFWPPKNPFISFDGDWRKKPKKNKYSDVSEYFEQQSGRLPYFPKHPLPLSQQQLTIEQPPLPAGPPPPPFNPAFVTEEQHASLTERATCLLSTGFIKLIIGSF